MISCRINELSHPSGCVLDPFNLIFNLEANDSLTMLEYFSWVPYDLYTHKDSSCDFSNVTLQELIMQLNESLLLPSQFLLYNIPMIYYVK